MATKKVLIPIDWSPNAEKAFDWYVYNLHKKGDTLILAHYIEATTEQELRRKEAHMQELQEVYETRLLQLHIDSMWLTGTASSPGEYIVKLSKEHNVSFIVMGARGLGKIKKAILGSVSDYIMTKCTVPVLICKMT